MTPAAIAMKNKLLIIIPAFNEEATISGVIASIKRHMPAADIVVVNDGSHDRTAERAASGGAVVLSHLYNLGIGATMQTGYKYARLKGYEIAVQVDADGQHPAEQIERLVKPVMEGKAEPAVGSRVPGRGDDK